MSDKENSDLSHTMPSKRDEIEDVNGEEQSLSSSRGPVIERYLDNVADNNNEGPLSDFPSRNVGFWQACLLLSHGPLPEESSGQFFARACRILDPDAENKLHDVSSDVRMTALMAGLSEDLHIYRRMHAQTMPTSDAFDEFTPSWTSYSLFTQSMLPSDEGDMQSTSTLVQSESEDTLPPLEEEMESSSPSLEEDTQNMSPSVQSEGQNLLPLLEGEVSSSPPLLQKILQSMSLSHESECPNSLPQPQAEMQRSPQPLQENSQSTPPSHQGNMQSKPSQLLQRRIIRFGRTSMIDRLNRLRRINMLRRMRLIIRSESLVPIKSRSISSQTNTASRAIIIMKRRSESCDMSPEEILDFWRTTTVCWRRWLRRWEAESLRMAGLDVSHRTPVKMVSSSYAELKPLRADGRTCLFKMDVFDGGFRAELNRERLKIFSLSDDESLEGRLDEKLNECQSVEGVVDENAGGQGDEQSPNEHSPDTSPNHFLEQ
ncbi:hypothetical protein K470DRAFT_265270 [Piedraia hortae CBS 480.64]|uniref:Uncharacterized protein n=1 Tax=Piedraia hortae CBS 480.64 TaxID=1314780 RepID=A0A6A7BW04_9PEZI|nr:hypothetical protein K470DRAFT_265270 [Piedraia hortae CBS 480.64]